MEVRITSDKFSLTPSHLGHLERRLQLAFSGLHNNVLSVHIRLRELKDRRSGNDKACHIIAAIPGCPEVVIKQLHENMYTVIQRVVQRAAFRAKSLLLQKCKATRRQRFVSSDMQPTVSAA